MSRTKNVVVIYPSELVRKCEEAIEKTGSFFQLFKFNWTPNTNATKDRVFLNLKFYHGEKGDKGWITIKLPLINYTFIGKEIDPDREFVSSVNLGIPCNAVYYRLSDGREEPLGQAFKYIQEAQEYLIGEEFKAGRINPAFQNAGRYLACFEAENEKTGEKSWWATIKINHEPEKQKNGKSKPATDESRIAGEFYDYEKCDLQNKIFVKSTIFNEETQLEEQLTYGNIHKWVEKDMIMYLAYIEFDTVSVDVKFMSGKGVLTYCIKKEPEILAHGIDENDEEYDAIFGGSSTNNTTQDTYEKPITNVIPVDETDKILINLNPPKPNFDEFESEFI